MRTDLKNAEGHKVRTGKLISQGAHSSMSVFFQRFKKVNYVNFPDLKETNRIFYELEATPEMAEWIDGKFTKVCLKVDSEQELVDIYNKAKDAGLPCSLIKDAGLTEFGFTLCKVCGDAIHSKGYTENCGYPLCECGDTAVEGKRIAVPTFTSVAIGPANSDEIDKITGGLKLL